MLISPFIILENGLRRRNFRAFIFDRRRLNPLFKLLNIRAATGSHFPKNCLDPWAFSQMLLAACLQEGL
jgi:hypothetical protein